MKPYLKDKFKNYEEKKKIVYSYKLKKINKYYFQKINKIKFIQENLFSLNIDFKAAIKVFSLILFYGSQVKSYKIFFIEFLLDFLMITAKIKTIKVTKNPPTIIKKIKLLKEKLF
jgi:hypothetical protein